jgi:hypothetical protein
LLPGPAGLLQQRNNTFENGTKVPSPNKRNEQPLAHDEELRSKKQKSNLSHAQIWDAMCLSMDRIVPACSNLGILRRALSPEYSLLVEVANAQCLKIKKLVVQIEAIHSHGHSDYTVDLSDESTRLLSSTIPRHVDGAESSSSVPMGWLSQSLIQMHPEWIRPGTVMLCHDVTIAVFRSNKGLIDRMILLGDENVVYAWTDDSVHMTTLGEQGKFSEDEKYLRLLERRAEVEERLRASIPPDYVSENESSCSGSEEDDMDIVDPDHSDILGVDVGSITGKEWLEFSEPIQIDTQQQQHQQQHQQHHQQQYHHQQQHLNHIDKTPQLSNIPKVDNTNRESQTGVPSQAIQEEMLQTKTNANSTSCCVVQQNGSGNIGDSTPSNQVQIDNISTDVTKSIGDSETTPKYFSSVCPGSNDTIRTAHQKRIVNPYSKVNGIMPETPIDVFETHNSTQSVNNTYSANLYARKVIQSIPCSSTRTEEEKRNQEISTNRGEEDTSSNLLQTTEDIEQVQSDTHRRRNNLEHISEKLRQENHGLKWDLVAEEIDDKDEFDEDNGNNSHEGSSEILISQNAMGEITSASCIFNSMDKIEDCDMDAFSE